MSLSTEAYNFWNLVFQLLIWLAMLATFMVYFHQLRQMQRGSTGQNILALVTFLQAPYVRDARTTVRKSLRAIPYENWSDKEKQDASLVCSTYDVAAILILQQHLVPKEPFVSNWGPSIKDCYEVCKPHIAEMQKPENSGATYWNDFGELYDRVVGRVT
jgi:hypothetical protein